MRPIPCTANRRARTAMTASVLATAIAFTQAATAQQAAAPAGARADLLIFDADVRTADPDHPRAAGLAVRDGRFIAYGTRAELDALVGPATRLLDAAGATVLPGFIDGHTHLASGGALVVGVDLYGIAAKADWLAEVAKQVDALPDGAWVLGGRWDHTLAEDTYPTRWDLDSAAPDNPVALTDIDHHSVWVNSAALEQAGIIAGTETPAGGAIAVDPLSGEPTGILKEGAMELLEAAPGYLEAVAESQRALPETVRLANSLGITSVHDMSGTEALNRYLEMARTRELTLRVWFGHTGARQPQQIHEVARRRERYQLRSPERGPLLALGYIKLMMDGVLSTHTAAMLEPYADRPGFAGAPFMEQERLHALLAAANEADLPVAIHAIGDRAVRLALDAFEAAGRRDVANRIEHVEILHPDDVGRFTALRVAASMQPNHATGVIGKYITERVGEQRERHAYVWGDLLRADTHLALSSDWPTAPLSPLSQLADALLRESPAGLVEGTWYPAQALEFDQALYAYTQANAALSAWGGEIGSITIGKWADFVVLDGTLPAQGREEIGRALESVAVRATFLAGEPVWERVD